MTPTPHDRSRPRLLLALGAALAALALPLSASAQGFPAKPLRIVVPFAPGGAVDTVARIVGERLSQQLGQQVLVENKPGNQANLGTQDVVRSPADGYTLLLGANGLATNPSLDKKLGFNPLVDLAPVARVGYAPLVMVVPSGSAPTSVKQLIEQAKAKPGAMSYGSSAVGGSGHLASELFKRSAGIEALHVAYKGGAPALTDLIGGRLDFMLINPLEAAPHVKSGRLRALAVATKRRLDSMPEVPTFAEAGVPGFEATVWWGFLVPAKTPQPVVQRLSDEILKALREEPVRQRLAAIGAVVDPQPAAEFGEFLKNETRIWGDIIRSAGITNE